MRGLSLETPAVDLIREHMLDPDSWFGLCPASNQAMPVTPELAEALYRSEITLLEMRAERARTAAQREHAAPVPPPEPNGSTRWFQNSYEGDPRYHGPLGRTRLTVVPETQGRAMPSTAEVKAAIDAANTDIAEGMELARQAQTKCETGKVKLMWVKETTVDTLGVPQVAEAISELERAQQFIHIAIENNQNYASNL
jgi:hypothetical protein